MGNTTSLFPGLLRPIIPLTIIFTRCVLVHLLSSSKTISSVGLLHTTMAFWIQLNLPDGGGVTSAQTTLLTILEQGRVPFLLPKNNVGILKSRLILCSQKFLILESFCPRKLIFLEIFPSRNFPSQITQKFSGP